MRKTGISGPLHPTMYILAHVDCNMFLVACSYRHFFSPHQEPLLSLCSLLWLCDGLCFTSVTPIRSPRPIQMLEPVEMGVKSENKIRLEWTNST